VIVDAQGEATRLDEPVRQCAWTRARAPKARLLRLVLDPSGQPWADLVGRAPGRGVYVQPDRDVVLQALAPKGLRRLFKGPVAPVEPRAWVEDAVGRLERRILEHLSLARRAGACSVGVEEVLALLACSPEPVVVLARDLSDRSAARVRAAAEGVPGARLAHLGSLATLGAKLGRSDTGAVAVGRSVFHRRLCDDLERHRRLTNTCEKQEGAGTVAS
jgi:hypothetical protein